jgi:hypothetical protein
LGLSELVIIIFWHQRNVINGGQILMLQVRHKLMGDSKVNTEGDQQNNINHKSTQQLLQIIDTTLLKCYLQVSQNNVMS